MRASEIPCIQWRKPLRSNGAQNCVEVGRASSFVGIRDTKNRAGGMLSVSSPAFGALVLAIKDGRLR
ncbi:DUF397 domain-containing protein [Actinoalloteichus sp. GBA129-24]|uniref:DUF397 domain-containing protein n=1 Tax=Actinoalloteichus sp. GBA129-24 TaxID=1612551 RepID=UPI0009504FEC|nr:DUF397 domain-containing protein [Actinoalloteichus sp. GBA129-24]APU22602.1 putative DUF397 family protein [Actinoalloteichus sp. GBA129-24]